jgi:hypothetical protein
MPLPIDNEAPKAPPTEEEKFQTALLKLSMVFKKSPSANLDEVIDDIVKKNGLDRAKFVDYVARHRQVITATVKGATR